MANSGLWELITIGSAVRNVAKSYLKAEASSTTAKQLYDASKITSSKRSTSDLHVQLLEKYRNDKVKHASQIKELGTSSKDTKRTLLGNSLDVQKDASGVKHLQEQSSKEIKNPISQPILPNKKDEISPAKPSAIDSSIKDVTKSHPATNANFTADFESSVEESYSTENKSPVILSSSKVPSSQWSRLWHYGGLATSLSVGAIGEKMKRMWGISKDDGALLLNERNVEILVNKLTQMRGAALKMGQMLSFQDSKLIDPRVSQILERVRDGAHSMPEKQLEQVMVKNLGKNWMTHYSEFDRKPMAAASIGQVHRARLASNHMEVVVKVQYPGVMSSIDSDLNNLAYLLKASRILPKGLFLENSIAAARKELKWECDYEREAAFAERFGSLLKNDSDFKVPMVFREASGPSVITLEYLHGIALGKQKYSQATRNHIGYLLTKQCLREISEYHFMQTDPNWSNFLYNGKTKKIELLDFGASIEYDEKFIKKYCRLLLAAAHRDREKCKKLSVELGYLNNHESAQMIDAHINSIFTLAEPFAFDAPDVYDFGDQTITARVKQQIPVMLDLRLQPPPEETYSLHRRLSGHFLLCAKLGAKVRCKELFSGMLRNYAD